MSTITDWIISIATIISTITTLSLVIFAFYQWKVLKEQIHVAAADHTVSVLNWIDDLMFSLRPKWHKLYLLDDNIELWSTDDRDLADHVGIELQRIAYIVEKRLVEPNIVLESYAKVFVQCWHKLKPFIIEYRISSGEPATIEQGAYQRKHLELFSRKCEEYLATRHLQTFQSRYSSILSGKSE
jgi:hypothetical protein